MKKMNQTPHRNGRNDTTGGGPDSWKSQTRVGLLSTLRKTSGTSERPRLYKMGRDWAKRIKIIIVVHLSSWMLPAWRNCNLPEEKGITRGQFERDIWDGCIIVRLQLIQ
jgi:hypothetical protein